MTKITATFLLSLSAALSLQGASVLAIPISTNDGAEAEYHGPAVVPADAISAATGFQGAQVIAPGIPLARGIVLNSLPPALSDQLGGLLGHLPIPIKVDVRKTDDAN